MLVLGCVGYQGKLGKLGASALIFLKLSNFIIWTYGAFNFLSRMGSINSFGQAGALNFLSRMSSINSFGQAVQEILFISSYSRL